MVKGGEGTAYCVVSCRVASRCVVCSCSIKAAALIGEEREFGVPDTVRECRVPIVKDPDSAERGPTMR